MLPFNQAGFTADHSLVQNHSIKKISEGSAIAPSGNSNSQQGNTERRELSQEVGLLGAGRGVPAGACDEVSSEGKSDEEGSENVMKVRRRILCISS